MIDKLYMLDADEKDQLFIKKINEIIEVLNHIDSLFPDIALFKKLAEKDIKKLQTEIKNKNGM